MTWPCGGGGPGQGSGARIVGLWTMQYIQRRCPGERRELVELVFMLLCHWLIFRVTYISDLRFPFFSWSPQS